MRRSFLVFMVLAILMIMLGSGVSEAARRVVVFEQATNVGCGCAGCLNPGLDSLRAYYGDAMVVYIRYHGDWPWAFDPFYHANPTELDERYAYYSITKMPTLVLDGEVIPQSCSAQYVRDAIEERFDAASPVKLVAADSILGDSCFVSVKVIAEGDAGPDSLTLRAAVIEDGIDYAAPNGEDVLNCVFRRFLPDHAGTRFAISQGETLDFQQAFEIDPLWNVAGLSTIVFVQREADKSIIQGVSSRARPDAWGWYEAASQGKVERPGRDVDFESMFTNLGAHLDTFDISLITDMPADWNAGFEIAGGGLGGSAVVIEPDSVCNITVTIGCGYESGTGRVTVMLQSRRDTAFARSLDFFAVSGICALLVDDDGGDDLESYYTEALDSLGVVWGRWDRSTAEPTLEDLSEPRFVIWFTGESTPTLDAHDRQVLAAYLAGDGRLFITGQDIGFRLCDMLSGESSQESRSFYERYLHARYIQSNSNLFNLSGRSGDPISDGLSIGIEGGDGADNQMFPDVIDSIAPAQVIFDYSDPLKHGGLRFDSDSSKVVYLSFGFEAISNSGDRVLLLSRIVSWFGETGGIDTEIPGPAVKCYPNPAVSYVTISLSGPGTASCIDIYDVTGRLVRQADFSSQGVFMWDLRDRRGNNVSSGVYFITVSGGDTPVHKKVILAR
jgi:hypothetical protein